MNCKRKIDFMALHLFPGLAIACTLSCTSVSRLQSYSRPPVWSRAPAPSCLFFIANSCTQSIQIESFNSRKHNISLEQVLDPSPQLLAIWKRLSLNTAARPQSVGSHREPHARAPPSSFQYTYHTASAHVCTHPAPAAHPSSKH